VMRRALPLRCSTQRWARWTEVLGRENCDLFLVVGNFRPRVVEEPLDGEVFEKPWVPRAHALEDFFTSFLVADDRIPCRQADRTCVRRVWQWTPEVILGPRRVACQVTGHGFSMPVIGALGKRDSLE